ncbi:prepilin peptidase [Microaceticoccus formicicus]|uniref:prepilin peptidase n=1 Tax=Microaceticoccus formicicus TaxID=3118105 RepID=UPI003CD03187|nr:prepilin peptidase [Peptoniphilaceae bacterium AMB_02]
MYHLIFIFGMIMGSFLNLVANRKLRGISIIAPPSHCMYCNKRLKIYSLIPIFSYIFQRGRCSFCNKKIPFDVFISELIVPVAYVIGLYNLGPSLLTIEYMVIFSVLYILVLTDLNSNTIYDSHLIVLFIMAGAALFYKFIIGEFNPVVGIMQMLLFLLFLKFRRLENTPIGEGDLLVFISLLSFFDFLNGIMLIFMSFWAAALYIPVLIFKGAGRKNKIAFLPFILASYFLIVNYGNAILKLMRWI